MLGGRTPRGVLPGLLVVCAGVLAMALPVSAIAAPVSASAVTARSPAAAHQVGLAHASLVGRTGNADNAAAPGRSASPSPVGSAPVRPVCAPVKPGYMRCDSLIRTDAAGHQGMLAAGVTPAGYGPADLQSAYALPSKTAGKGATVAIVDAYDDPVAESDLAVYRSTYGLPPCTTANGCFRKINQNGGSEPPAQNESWATEISVDLDMVSAVCPNCRILLVEADDDSSQSLGAAEDEAVAQGAKYVSDSWGTEESYIQKGQEATWDREYFDHPGVAITAASGDEGYQVSYPAASRDVVAVGGTTLTRDPSSPRGWSETVWDGTGSGCSAYESKPSWQTDTGCTNRTDNDVAAIADPDTGVAVYDSWGVEGWTVLGGTSVATPIIASAYALAGTPAGGTYPGSYPYANPSALNKVTSGSNGTCSPAYLCTGEPGYNGPSGLGTPEGVAAFQAGPHGQVSGTVRDSTGRPVPGVTVSIGLASAVTDASGRYATTALDGSYRASAAKFGYASQTASVTVARDATATLNFTLTKYPTGIISGKVTDASGHGWPLYAQIRVAGTSATAYTNPVTGRYQIALPVTGSAYTLDTSAIYPGYQASDTSVTPAAGGVQQNIGLSVNPLSCSAPGYQPVYHGYTQTFSTGARPAGWTETSGPASQNWVFNDPEHVPNYTGGSGGFALADGVGSVMYTPAINLSGDPHPVLRFDTDMQPGSLISVSTDGESWFPAFVANTEVPGPATETVPLPMAARQPDVELEFQADYEDWEVDNVFVGELGCAAVPGGLVVGQALDRNTGQPVDGAQVARAGSPAVTTAPSPGDPDVGGGLYWLFSPVGQQTLTASASGYSPATATVTVASGAVTQADFALAAPRLAIRPGAITGTAPMGGGAVTERLTVANTGSAPATVSLDAQQGTFTMAGQPAGRGLAGSARAAAAPVRTISGHFGPGLAGQPGGPPASAARAPAQQGGGDRPDGSDTSWTPIAHFPEDQADMAGATDPATGRVYAVGGDESSQGDSSAAWVFTPAAGTWSQLPDMSYEREAPAAAFIGGKLYVTAGYDSADTDDQPALEIYDPSTGLWSSGAPIPHPYYGSATAVVGGKMYVIGGCSTGSCGYRNTQVYNPATNTWHQAAAYPLPVAFPSCGGIGGTLYCAGGYDGQLGYGTAAAYAYNPQTRAWTRIASLPIDLWASTYASANGQLLVSGGITRFDDELTNQGFAYDPAAAAWTPLPNAADTVYRAGSACGLYQIGGYTVSPQSQVSYADTAEQLPGYGECDGGTGVPWLSASLGNSTLRPGQQTTITVTLNPAGSSISQPGSYTATLWADAATPYLAPQASVTLDATPPRSWGELAGTVHGTACHGTTSALAGASVQVDSAAGSWTLTTDSNGRYATWLDTSDSPLTVIVSDGPGWRAQAVTARLTAGKITTLNVALSPAGC
jgi:N-acetylneuraminic acid mutarotase